MLNTNKLTDEETKTLKKKALEILSNCRRDVLADYPFIGSIALRMDMVPVRDVRVRTACTDGNTVYFDIAFLSSLTRQEQTFVLAHEIWHAVLMHLVRCQNRDPQLFNIATDKEVNSMLKKDGMTPPSDVCMPTSEEEDKCAEEIYEMLLKKMKKQHNGQQSGNGNGNGNSGQSSSRNGNRQGNGNGSGQKDGKDTGELTGQFDKHIYDGKEDDRQQGNNGDGSQQNGSNDDSNGNANGSGQPSQYGKIVDKYGEVGFDSDYQPKVSKDFADKMREAIVAEAQRAEKMKGTLPAHIKSLVKKVTSTELHWSELLAQFVTRCYNGGRRSWIPPNRRHVHNNVYLQSRQADKISVCLGIDSSGSTVGDRGKFLAELSSLIKSFGLFDLHIIECDAEVGAYKHYTQDDYLEQEIEGGDYAMTGGGGTAMRPIYDYILDNNIECDCIVIMTDGYIDHIPENPIPSIPTLWVITKDGTEDFCNWGQKIKLKFSDNDM